MQAAGKEFLRSYPNFAGILASAETTTLAEHSIDSVTAGQAFHWFDPIASRKEFSRILKPGGWVVVVCNERQTDSTPFLRDYEALLRRFGTDYARVSDSYPVPEDMDGFFGRHNYLSHELPNLQEFDFDGLSGRLRSSSYAPAAGHPDFPQMMNELNHIFTAYQKNGVVRFDYRTRIYAGNLDTTGTGA
jgi:SAM-dependent methyltransferase